MIKRHHKGFYRSFIREVFSTEIRNLFVIVVALLAVGTAYYKAVEGWSTVDSLYFSITTLTTVGYGDLAPTTDASKIFTSVYILIGLGVVLTFLQMLARQQAKEPFIRKLFHRRKK